MVDCYVKTVPLFSQVEAQLSSEDFGRDLSGVQSLIKKHRLAESDITAHMVHGCHSNIAMLIQLQ